METNDTAKQVEHLSYRAYDLLDPSAIIDIVEVNDEDWSMPEREIYLVAAAYCSH
jgi:hypothetical protein